MTIMTNQKRTAWAGSLIRILDAVGSEFDYCNTLDIYSALVKEHKAIFGTDHDRVWVSGITRDTLNAYLLIRIFGMVKHTKDTKRRKSK